MTCPVDCIHYVDWKELRALEAEREGIDINFKAKLVGNEHDNIRNGQQVVIVCSALDDFERCCSVVRSNVLCGGSWLVGDRRSSVPAVGMFVYRCMQDQESRRRVSSLV